MILDCFYCPFKSRPSFVDIFISFNFSGKSHRRHSWEVWTIDSLREMGVAEEQMATWKAEPTKKPEEVVTNAPSAPTSPAPTLTTMKTTTNTTEQHQPKILITNTNTTTNTTVYTTTEKPLYPDSEEEGTKDSGDYFGPENDILGSRLIKPPVSRL